MIPSYYDAPDIVEGSVAMRGDDRQTGWMFSYVSPEERMPTNHPLRAIRRMTDAILERLSPRFDRLYSDIGRPSIPPEKLLRALLLQGLYTVRSERLLMEQLQYNLLFRWFVGLSMDAPCPITQSARQKCPSGRGLPRSSGPSCGDARPVALVTCASCLRCRIRCGFCLWRWPAGSISSSAT